MRMLSFFLVLLSFLAYGQEESFPCKRANPQLKNLLSTGQMDQLYVLWCSGDGLGELSSSYLAPSGQPPKIIEVPGDIPDDSKYVAWTCRYAPGNLQDGNPATAWVEGTPEYGIGEVVIIPCLDLSQPVEIWSGFGKSENLFQYNSRPSKVKVYIIQAKFDAEVQIGKYYKDLQVIEQAEVSLRDFNGYQQLELPKFTPTQFIHPQSKAEMDYSYFLGIEILDIYPGTKWKDTCISEVRNKQ
jgi:hypothetical protein